MTVAELSERMSSSELTEWFGLWRLERLEQAQREQDRKHS